ncbi:MAG TPA: 1,4-dihydroxy-2-naphthoate octaprenyltransferase [Ignavibacteriales bacterium]|nr:1,4-dihydroxy-2-naphthoate octaprenyltransferase [Ignavibacteriales bacterium]HPD67256.1 1,4-dihydroxy-2-naphthoate octaprenyltransferase [Ignavibacteriales bacterium]HRR17767.1 1,4-dihydroxy-2-naphthoate octaprenyltransferase [Ignavibacteriales bacterium]HRT98545.1 1,4-dihydroxy-2-naphthoate octaprenyltransferase [Ignavibacteriales bacterium]
MIEKIKIWIMAARPKTLLAIISPIIVGNVYVFVFDRNLYSLWVGVITLLSALLIQIGTNFVNDLYDFLRGSDTKERKGPTRVVAAGLVKPEIMKIAIRIVFITAFVLGMLLVYNLQIKFGKGIYLLIVGILSIIFAYIYTGGPFPLAYNGLGDIAAVVFFGIIATCGSAYVHTGEIYLPLFLVSFSLGLLIDNILVVNNYRDYNEDKKNNKKTLIVILGEKSGIYLYSINVFLAIFIMLLFKYIFLKPLSFYLFPLDIALIFLVIKNIKLIKKLYGVYLNSLLGETSKYLFLFAILLSINMLIGG